ncbi:Dynamin-related 3B -like protein [Gossypium arboreum]|uniref:Dynamin-related 3B-like protein n=1 Tax=Gossypium arboreum TaxID=29729 RepID=A0A0B0PLP7_GOSAR|nr:Dynamin-related 3B -like protein [Gossypium arboreum]
MAEEAAVASTPPQSSAPPLGSTVIPIVNKLQDISLNLVASIAEWKLMWVIGAAYTREFSRKWDGSLLRCYPKWWQWQIKSSYTFNA